MGMLIDGRWSHDDDEIAKGQYTRASSVYAADIEPEVALALRDSPGRYCLIASMSCQWSQRTLITRELKRLRANLPIQIAFGERVEGYAVNGGKAWQVPGSQQSIRHLHQLYSLSDAAYTGTVTVPVLWDSQDLRIVCNESAKIQRALDAVPAAPGEIDFCLVPPRFATEIDELNAEIYANLSNGVYQVGFAQSQSAYDEAIDKVFAQLDALELRLSRQRFLFENIFTEADICLFSTLVRFDAVYYVLHRCCRRRLVDYPNLWAYSRDLYAWPQIARSVDFYSIRTSSYQNDTLNNPCRIIADAPDTNWSRPHGREQLGAAGYMGRDGKLLEFGPFRI